MKEDSIVLLGCGDVGPVHEPTGPYSTLVKPVLAAGDIRFAQCERMCSDLGTQQVHGSPTGRVKPHMASIFSDCGYDVVSVAGNHGMDWGADALLDTMDNLRKRGIAAIGGGRNLQEARAPAIIERKGVRVAFLAYCSILNLGYEAGPNKAGISPMRVHTYYEPAEYQAGMPPRVITEPYAEDLAGMVEDIANAKKAAHVVVVSMHWGLHYIARAIAYYQPTVAKAAFKAGADLILGHHAHVPKAVEVFDGKACFYSLGNFIMTDYSGIKPGLHAKMKRYGITPDLDEYPLFPAGKDSHRGMIAKAHLTRSGVQKVSFLPVQIDKQMRPEVLAGSDPRFDEALKFMDWVSEDQHHKFRAEGGEIVVEG